MADEKTPQISADTPESFIEKVLTAEEEPPKDKTVPEPILEGDDAAPGEPASGDTDESEAEPAEPAIEPPSSWKAEDKALWPTLPREVQQVLTAREAEREAGISRRLEELAGERKAQEAERKQLSDARTQLIQQQEAALRTLYPELQLFQGVNWQELARTDPNQYIELDAQRQALIGKIQTAQGELERARQEHSDANRKALQERFADEKIKLAAALPVFADPVKGKETAQKLNQYLRDQGYTEDEINHIADHRTIKLVYKAWLADQSAAAKQAAQAKQTKTVPKMVRPGQVPDADERSAKALAGSMGNLRKHGTTEAAAAFLEKLL